jgi:hypothetical protein
MSTSSAARWLNCCGGSLPPFLEFVLVVLVGLVAGLFVAAVLRVVV